MIRFWLLILISLSAFGNEENAHKSINKLIGLSLEELLEIEIVVASQTEETIFDAPSSVTVFTRPQLLRMGITNVEELLNFVPGFVSTREIVFGQGYMVSARGSTTPQSSYNILFMLDGQRLNNDLRGGALDSYGHFISLANVKQVEIIRGPGSASYGTGAVTGVVNIITDTNLNEAFVSVGNLNSREGYLNTSHKEKNWSISLFARYFEDQGENYTNLINPYKHLSTNDPRQGRDIQLRFNYDKLQLNLRHNLRRVEDFYITNNIGNDINVSSGQQDFISFNYKILDNQHWKLNLEGNYTMIDSKMTAEVASQEMLQALPESVITKQRVAALQTTVTKEKSTNLALNGQYHFDKKNILFAGLNWYRPNINTDREFDNYNTIQLVNLLTQKMPAGQLAYYDPPLESVASAETYRDIIGGYLQHKYQINQQLDLTYGAHYDHYSDVGSTITPRIALVYSPVEKTKFKWMYGEAFRAPAVRQVSAAGIGIGNPNLRPEKIKTMELAWLQQFENLQSTFTYFYSRASDRIDTMLISGTTNRRFENLQGHLDTSGIEIEASIELSKEFSLRGAYSWLQKTEENPRRFPKQTFSLITNYHYDRWDFNLNTLFHDTMQQQVSRTNFIDLDKYWIVNTNIRYNLSNQLTLVGHINNLFDQTYYSSSKNVAFLEGVINRGRTYSLGLELRF
jgi:outer membrane receptor protein involved in Fe transport